jgi:tetratricopeptide (TPR) repeat protein
VDSLTWNDAARITAIFAGVFFGSMAISSASWVWVRKQIFAYGGSALSGAGVILIGLSIWHSVEFGVTARFLTLKLAQEIASLLQSQREGTGGAAAHNSAIALDEAVAQYRQAIALDPKNIIPRVSLANALLSQGKLDEAIVESQDAIALDPRNAAARVSLGNALELQLKPAAAILEYLDAIALDPRDAAAHTSLGNALQSQGKFDEAIAEYRKAIALDPRDAAAHTSLGNALQSQGKLDEAIAEYREAVQLMAASIASYAPSLRVEGEAATR